MGWCGVSENHLKTYKEISEFLWFAKFYDFKISALDVDIYSVPVVLFPAETIKKIIFEYH